MPAPVYRQPHGAADCGREQFFIVPVEALYPCLSGRCRRAGPQLTPAYC
ncbi:hypothetical protein MUN86_27340 (plasmid) [Hymenobacter volaticus]|uniref:Uncharacterized protein n=1 Tax=Hymenobacter volaticus TaxID=2932254 RepID=A0ABY4GF71_9BACT|nr:hypothetical protein MUN86_27340 [Hymenobacter volaticus]